MSFEISVFSFFGKIDFWHLFLTVVFYPKTSPTFQYDLFIWLKLFAWDMFDA